MNEYELICQTVCKNKRFWVDLDFRIDIVEESENALIEELKRYAYEEKYITITKNAIKNKSAMYIDKQGESKQIGYVINASTEIFDDEKYKYIKVPLELWVEIRLLTNLFD